MVRELFEKPKMEVPLRASTITVLNTLFLTKRSKPSKTTLESRVVQVHKNQAERKERQFAPVPELFANSRLLKPQPMATNVCLFESSNYKIYIILGMEMQKAQTVKCLVYKDAV